MFKQNVSAFLIVGFILMVSPAVFAETPSEIGRLTYVQGRVDRSQISSTESYTPVVKDESVSIGDIVRTKSFSRAEITFADRSVVRLGENTQVNFREYAFDEKGARTGALLDMERGKIRAIVSKFGSGSKFDIRTPNALGTIKGSDIFVSYQKSATSVLSLEGEIVTKGLEQAGQTVVVKPGHTALVPSGASPQAPRPFIALEKTRLESETEPAAQAKEGAAHIVLGKAVVTNFSGAVRVRAKDTEAWHRPDVKEALAGGDEIETGPDGNVRLVLDSGRVVDVQPGTQLKVSRIFYDPATGAHEDIFESKMGKLRVQVEKLKQGSKFEVRTPTAVAAVRGTIMYLNILPNVTTAFFQNGNGLLTNLFNNVSREVMAGQNSSADDQGNVTEPTPTTPAQLDALETASGESNQTYGYSDPGATSPGDAPVFQNTDLSFHDIKIDVDPATLFDDIPVDTDTDTETPPTLAAFNGRWGQENGREEINSLYYGDEGYLYRGGEEFGLIGALTSPWDEPSAFLAIGRYTLDTVESGEPLLWNTKIYGGSEGEETLLTHDGGAFWGYTAGLWKNDAMEGTIAAIYLDPEGNAGVLSGGVTGQFFTAPEIWVASGTLTAAPFSQGLGADPAHFDEYVQSGEIYALLEGEFPDLEEQVWEGDYPYLTAEVESGSTYFFHADDGESASQLWGLFDLTLGDGIQNVYDTYNYYNPEGSKVWIADLEGEGVFDHYYSEPSEPGNYFIDGGSWFGTAVGSWENGEIRGKLAGIYLTENGSAGVMLGDVFGLYQESGEGYGFWVGESLGIFMERAQRIDLSPEELFYHTDDTDLKGSGLGGFVDGGSLVVDRMRGVAIGIDQEDWGAWVGLLQGSYEDAAPDFHFAVGGIADDGKNENRAGWLGTVRGGWDESSEALHGKMQAIWVSEHDLPDGKFETGRITGDVSGRLDPETGSWQAVASGEWTEIGDLDAAAVGYAMDDLINFVNIPITEVHQSLLTGSGSFDGAGVINAVVDASFYGHDAAATSGLWAALVSGSFSGAPGSIEAWSTTVSGPSNVGDITADFAGITWAENQWTANVSGSSVNGLEFSGQAAGTYAPVGEVAGSGTFQGVGTGTWEVPQAPLVVETGSQ